MIEAKSGQEASRRNGFGKQEERAAVSRMAGRKTLAALSASNGSRFWVASFADEFEEGEGLCH
jgi:hypothetical protein